MARVRARSRFPGTPLWVRALLAVACLGAPAWGIAQWHDRTVNQRRLGAIASQVAGRRVTVRCPGVLGRALRLDTVEGTVRFDADGRPADETKLRTLTCAELDALAEGRRDALLACLARTGDCGPGEDDLALALDVLTHESYHLAGYADEAVTECRSLQTMAWTAAQFGVRPEVARRLAEREAVHAYPRMPSQYHGPCELGGQAAPSAGR
jgi:hypothetical protein